MAKKATLRAMSAATGPPGFVAYLRVSTDKQGRSGLGLEAQKAAVDRHITSSGARLLAQFVEVESGRKDDRPELHKALAAARSRRAVLLIAKLDRLSRDAHFLLGLQKAGVEFIAADMPTANRLTVGIMALVAEEEARMISARTIAALAAAKARGTKLGNPRLQAGDAASARLANAAKTAASQQHAEDVMPYIEAARGAGAVSLKQIGEALTARGVCTPSGGAIWRDEQVRRILKRAASPAKPGLPPAG